jgi:hypothetical protein
MLAISTVMIDQGKGWSDMKAALALTGPGSTAVTSKQIAEVTLKKHKVILRDGRSMLLDLYGKEALQRIIPLFHRLRPDEYIRANLDAVFSAVFEDGTNLYHHYARGFSWKRDARGYSRIAQ